VAAKKVRTLAGDDSTDWWITDHFKNQLKERNIISSDIKHLLRTGYVYKEGTESTVPGLWKYQLEGSITSLSQLARHTATQSQITIDWTPDAERPYAPAA
jgi:hypothetical protein